MTGGGTLPRRTDGRKRAGGGGPRGRGGRGRGGGGYKGRRKCICSDLESLRILLRREMSQKCTFQSLIIFLASFKDDKWR